MFAVLRHEHSELEVFKPVNNTNWSVWWLGGKKRAKQQVTAVLMPIFKLQLWLVQPFTRPPPTVQPHSPLNPASAPSHLFYNRSSLIYSKPWSHSFPSQLYLYFCYSSYYQKWHVGRLKSNDRIIPNNNTFFKKNRVNGLFLIYGFSILPEHTKHIKLLPSFTFIYAFST